MVRSRMASVVPGPARAGGCNVESAPAPRTERPGPRTESGSRPRPGLGHGAHAALLEPPLTGARCALPLLPTGAPLLREAGFEEIRCSVFTTCLTGPEVGEFAEFQVRAMHEAVERMPTPPTPDEVARSEAAWRIWEAHPDALFVRHRIATLARRPA